MWYLWCGEHSPLFGRTRMTTFERYFIADPATHAEPKGPYYRLRESETFCRKVLASNRSRGYAPPAPDNGRTAMQGETQ